MVTFDPATGELCHVSANIGDFLHAAELAHSLFDLLGAEAGSAVLESASRGRPGATRHEVVDLPASPSAGWPHALEIVVHRHAGLGYAEIFNGDGVALRNRDWMQLFTDSVDALKHLTDLQAFADAIVQRIKHFSGLDRVMVYRFSAEGHGHVMSDAHEPGMDSLLGLHYPESDIPAQARELYRSNLVRYIADVDYRPVQVQPRGVLQTALALDMSHVQLRSVSPVHLQYLRNMGVKATLTLSLLVDGQLWGLIACHHRTPAALSNRLLRALHPFAFTAGFMLAWILQRKAQAAAAATMNDKHDIVAAFSDAGQNFDQVVADCAASLTSITAASGGVLWRRAELTPFGALPTSLCADVVGHARTLLAESTGAVVNTTGGLWGAGATAENLSFACGVLAVRFDSASDSGIVWVRPELAFETQWGGNPDKPVAIEVDAQGRPTLQPRTSFARWKVITEGQCRPWSSLETDAARSLIGLGQLLVVREEIDQLSESDRRLRGLLALQAQVLWRTDAAGRLVSLSSPLPCGAAPSTALHIAEALEPWYDPSSLDELKLVLNGTSPFRGFLLKGRSATQAADSLLELDGERYGDAGSKTGGWHGSFREIAAQRRDEEAAHHREAQRIAEMECARFLRSVSHEMRTPLHAVQAFSFLLLKDASLPPQARHRLQRIKSAGDLMLGMVDDLMDVARAQTDPVPIRQEEVDAQGIVLAVAELIKPDAMQRLLRVVVEPSSAIWALADAKHLKRVLLILASNAVKYNQPGGEVRFQVSDDPGKCTVRIDVRDTGEGLTPQQLARLFQPFDRLGREGLAIEGMGLGLSIARSLLDAMEGGLAVSSEPGKGSCFSVELPRATHSATR